MEACTTHPETGSSDEDVSPRIKDPSMESLFESIPTCRRENLEKAPEIRGSVPSSTLGYDNVMEMYTGLGSFAAAIVAHECFANSSR